MSLFLYTNTNIISGGYYKDTQKVIPQVIHQLSTKLSTTQYHAKKSLIARFYCKKNRVIHQKWLHYYY